MPKLTKVAQQVFGSTAGIDQLGIFGSLAAGSPTFTTSPTEIQSLTNFLDGWFSAIVGENSPAIQDMNSLFFLAFYQLSYLIQQGIAEWDAETTYYQGSFASDPAGTGNLYVSLADNNVNKPLTNTAFWKPFQNSGTVLTTSTSVGLNQGVYTILSNSTSGIITLTLPPFASANAGSMITIKDVGTGGNHTAITVSQAGGASTIDGNTTYATNLSQNDSISVIYNAGNWYVV